MEDTKRKRGREEGQEMKMKKKKITKTLKRDYNMCNHHHHRQHQEEESDESQISLPCDKKYVGVFDFPWLHDEQGGMLLPKCCDEEEEYWNFNQNSCSPYPCLYETPSPSTPPSLTKLDLEVPEMESVDCIWNCILNQSSPDDSSSTASTSSTSNTSNP